MLIVLQKLVKCCASSLNFSDRKSTIYPMWLTLTKDFWSSSFGNFIGQNEFVINIWPPSLKNIKRRWTRVKERRRNLYHPSWRQNYLLQVDLIQWLLESAEGVEKETDQLVSRILMVNFAAIHTTSMVLAALFQEGIDLVRHSLTRSMTSSPIQKSFNLCAMKLNHLLQNTAGRNRHSWRWRS